MTRPALKLDAETCANPDLQRAAEDLFLRRRQGHMDPFSYSTPLHPGDQVRGSQLWANFLATNENYRIPHEEAALIRRVAPLLGRFTGEFSEFIDFGPGSIEAFDAKTHPLLERLNVRTYRPIDLCQRFLSDIEITLRKSNASITVRPERKDFLAGALAPAAGPSWLYWGGSGFANIPTTGGSGLPLAGLRTRLSRLRAMLPAGSHCLITLDTNRRHDALMRAYDHPLGAALTLNLLHQIRRDCPDIVLDPHGWDYRPVWNAAQYVLEHRIVARQAQVVQLPDRTVRIAGGESFVTDHSFKLPAALVEDVAKSVGWQRAMTLGHDGHVQLLVLSA